MMVEIEKIEKMYWDVLENGNLIFEDENVEIYIWDGKVFVFRVDEDGNFELFEIDGKFKGDFNLYTGYNVDRFLEIEKVDF